MERSQYKWVKFSSSLLGINTVIKCTNQKVAVIIKKGYGGNSQPNWNRDFKENVPWGTGWRIGFLCAVVCHSYYLISNILLKNMNSIVLQ